MHYLSSCSIVKDEFPYILEFYKIHKHLGVEFFLFFDRSTEGPPLQNLFKNFVDVEVINFPEPNRHAHAWRDGVKYFKGKSRWVQFIDIDQVTVPLKTNDIKIMLQNYEPFSALGLNWHSFGSNNREVEPQNTVSTYEVYTKRAIGDTPINSHIQSIVQVEMAESEIWRDPHHPILKSGNHQVNEHKQTFFGPFNKPITQDVGFIAHYYTRSREYWSKKISKMRADTGTSGGSLLDFDHHQSYMNTVEDLTVKNIWESCTDK